MNRQRGISSLAMVLMLLVTGSLMLQGLNQALRQQTANVSAESRALQRAAEVHTALQWGKVQSWTAEAGAQCLVHGDITRVCLRLFDDGTLLLVAKNETLMLWQSGRWAAGSIRFSAHGWSDFCPFKEVTRCQIP